MHFKSAKWHPKVGELHLRVEDLEKSGW